VLLRIALLRHLHDIGRRHAPLVLLRLGGIAVVVISDGGKWGGLTCKEEEEAGRVLREVAAATSAPDLVGGGSRRWCWAGMDGGDGRWVDRGGGGRGWLGRRSLLFFTFFIS
jgi:hypothetical protein